MIGHVFKMVEAEFGGKRIDFEWNNQDFMQGLTQSCRKETLYVEDTGNSYCLVQMPVDTVGVWKKGPFRKYCVIASFSVTGDILWIIKPSDLWKYFATGKNISSFQRAEYATILEFFKISFELTKQEMDRVETNRRTVSA